MNLNLRNQAFERNTILAVGLTFLLVLSACGSKETVMVEKSPPSSSNTQPKSDRVSHSVPDSLLGAWTSTYSENAFHQYRFLPDNAFIEIVRTDSLDCKQERPICFQQFTGKVTSFTTDIPAAEVRYIFHLNLGVPPVSPDFKVGMSIQEAKLTKDSEMNPECEIYNESLKWYHQSMPSQVLWFGQENEIKIVNAETGTAFFKED